MYRSLKVTITYSKEKCPEKRSLKIIKFEENENENELIISS
jgi:hypothetical protein